MIQTNRAGGNAVIRITIAIPASRVPVPPEPPLTPEQDRAEKVDKIVQQAIKELNDYWAAIHINEADCDADLARIEAEIAARKASKIVVDLS